MIKRWIRTWQVKRMDKDMLLFNAGERAFKQGIKPSGCLLRLNSRAYILWIHGWSHAWVMEESERE